MNKLRAALTALSKSLGIQSALHKRAVARMKSRHAGQKKAERQAEAARKQGDRLRGEAFKASGVSMDKYTRLRAKAERKDSKALRFDLKAEREKTRAVFWRGRAGVLAKRLAGIENDVGKIKQEISKLGATVDGNHVKGGDEFDRWLLCLLTSAHNCSTVTRRNFYSMGGSWDIDHELVGGPQFGNRSDCSSTVTGWAKACGFDDPNGANFTGGFTGTLISGAGRWKEVSLDHMLKARRPGFVVYGSGVGHHTEAWCPSIDDQGNYIDALRTVGHGSAPVDFGTVHLFGSGEVERYFILTEG